MPFGILECNKMEVVPGTGEFFVTHVIPIESHSNSPEAFMSDQEDLPPEYQTIPRELLKHGKGRFSHVILVPQPSDSPNDPLNVSPPSRSTMSWGII